MQKVIDLSGLYYLGLAIGATLITLLTYSSENQPSVSLLTSGNSQVSVFESYPYIFATSINGILAVVSVIILLIFYPKFSEKKQ